MEFKRQKNKKFVEPLEDLTKGENELFSRFLQGIRLELMDSGLIPGEITDDVKIREEGRAREEDNEENERQEVYNNTFKTTRSIAGL